jgi:hypothetical protein
MAAAEYQRTGTIKRIEQRKRLGTGFCGHQRCDQEQHCEQHERGHAMSTRHGKAELAGRCRPIFAAKPEPG